MGQIDVGKDILSYCNKCQLALNHIIVTMKTANTPHKVECQTCKGTHNFKDPQAAKKKKKTSRRKTKAEIRPIGEVWKQAISESNGNTVKYSIKTTFQTGDVIDHVKFGQGVVQAIVDGNKVEVLFETDVKILVHARS